MGLYPQQLLVPYCFSKSAYVLNHPHVYIYILVSAHDVFQGVRRSLVLVGLSVSLTPCQADWCPTTSQLPLIRLTVLLFSVSVPQLDEQPAMKLLLNSPLRMKKPAARTRVGPAMKESDYLCPGFTERQFSWIYHSEIINACVFFYYRTRVRRGRLVIKG